MESSRAPRSEPDGLQPAEWQDDAAWMAQLGLESDAEQAPAPDETAGNWRFRAACRGQDTDKIFFPNKGGSLDAARLFCGKCIVADECLELAMGAETGSERHGVYGGLSGTQRTHIARLRKMGQLAQADTKIREFRRNGYADARRAASNKAK